MRYSPRAVQLLLLGPFLLTPAVAQSPNDFQRMDNLPTLDCTTAWNSAIPYCTDSDFVNGAACSQGCAYGVELTQEGIQQLCGGGHYAADSLMGLFMAGKGTQILCPNALATQAMGGSIETSLSVSSLSRPTSLALATVVASSTVTSTVTSTASVASSSVSSSFDSLTTTVLVHSTFVTHATTTLSSAFVPTSSSTSTGSASTSTSTPALTPTSTSTSTSTPTSTSALTSSSMTTPLSSSTTTPPATGSLQTAISGASVTVQPTTTSAFLQTAVNGGSVTVLSSKPAQTSSTNPDAFGGGGSPFEIPSPASRSTSSLRSWTSVVALGCVLWMVWG